MFSFKIANIRFFIDIMKQKKDATQSGVFCCLI